MFYTIQNEQLLIADKKESLTRFYSDVKILPSDYEANKYIVQNGKLVLNSNFEAQQEQKERERIAKLYLTGADVERGIYQAKEMDFDDILAYITQLQPQGLDIKALKIELKANNFYRGNPYVSAIGALLGFTDEQLDLFFETNDYTVLLPKEEPTETPTEAPVETPTETPIEDEVE